MKSKKKNALVGLIVLTAGLILGIGLAVFMSLRQASLDKALIAAIKGKDARQTIALLDQGANPNAVDNSGDDVSIKSLAVEFWDRLKGASPLSRPFHPTALALTFDRNLWYSGATKEEVWAAFLRHHADPLTRDEMGGTLLSSAAFDDHAPTVRLLMALHVDPNLTDGFGNPALTYTDYDCARILIDNGADPNCRGFGGETPLIASARNYFSTGNLLLDHHADINAQNRDGQTPLMQAFLYHKYDFSNARALLDHGARVTIHDRFGKTALDYARKRKIGPLKARLEAIARQEQHLH